MAIPDQTQGYEVYALRYALNRGFRASQAFSLYQLQGAEDYELGMDYFFWLLRSQSRVVVVDSGWNRDRNADRAMQQTNPVELLARLDVSPAMVDHVIVSHMHADHIGNLDLFTNARFSVPRAEFECWTGPYSAYPSIAHPTAAEDVRVVEQLVREDRVDFVDEVQEVLPGITVTRVGGHSPGQCIVDVANPTETVVLASDAAHHHAEIDRAWPFVIYTNLFEMVAGFELLRAKERERDTFVVTGHDPVEMERFAQVEVDCLDLTKPLA